MVSAVLAEFRAKKKLIKTTISALLKSNESVEAKRVIWLTFYATKSMRKKSPGAWKDAKIPESTMMGSFITKYADERKKSPESSKKGVT